MLSGLAVYPTVLPFKGTSHPRYVSVDGGGSVTVKCEVDDVIVEYGSNAWTAHASTNRPGFTKSYILNTTQISNNSAIIVWKCTTAGTYTLTNSSSQNPGWFVCEQ